MDWGRRHGNRPFNQLYEWMQDSTFDDGVAVGLPGVDVVHKTGWMPMYTVSNDISLVKDEKNIRTVWFQLGLVNNEAAQKAKDAGLNVIQNKCTKIEHKALF